MYKLNYRKYSRKHSKNTVSLSEINEAPNENTHNNYLENYFGVLGDNSKGKQSSKKESNSGKNSSGEKEKNQAQKKIPLKMKIPIKLIIMAILKTLLFHLIQIR